MDSCDVVHAIDRLFLKSIPQSELSHSNLSKIYVGHIEPAFYYYLDFLRAKNPNVHHFKNLKEFSMAVFKYSQILANLSVDVPREFSAFIVYKRQIPAYGGILLNKDNDKVLLVRDNSKNWTFPKGKQMPGESDINCAKREVMEETGFDITNYVDEAEFITMQVESGQPRRGRPIETRVLKLYIVRNVPESYNFRPQTINEISGLKFYSLNAIPSNNYHITKFLHPLFERLR